MLAFCFTQYCFNSPHQFSPKGNICRGSVDECDLHEYCNGSSAECQKMCIFRMGIRVDRINGSVSGKCMDGGKQCVELFGEGIYFNLTAVYVFSGN